MAAQDGPSFLDEAFGEDPTAVARRLRDEGRLVWRDPNLGVIVVSAPDAAGAAPLEPVPQAPQPRLARTVHGPGGRDVHHLPNTVEETLRYEPPVLATDRIATRDGSIDGCPYRRGDWLLPLFAGFPATGGIVFQAGWPGTAPVVDPNDSTQYSASDNNNGANTAGDFKYTTTLTVTDGQGRTTSPTHDPDVENEGPPAVVSRQ